MLFILYVLYCRVVALVVVCFVVAGFVVELAAGFAVVCFVVLCSVVLSVCCAGCEFSRYELTPDVRLTLTVTLLLPLALYCVPEPPLNACAQ